MRELGLNETFDGLIAWDSFFHLTQQDQQRCSRFLTDSAVPAAR